MKSLEMARPERLWSRVAANGECLEWTGTKTAGGYGQIKVAGRIYSTHRLAWMLRRGPIPDGMVVDHVCHNRACVNVSHMRLANVKQNTENRAGANKNSSSGIRGVTWDKQHGRWAAIVGHLGKNYRAGLFGSKAEAEAAVIALRNDLYSGVEVMRPGGWHKLTDDQVKAIIEAYGTGVHSQTAIARMYGCSQSQVSNIVRRKQRWTA